MGPAPWRAADRVLRWVIQQSLANIYRTWLDREVPRERLVDLIGAAHLQRPTPTVDGPEWPAVTELISGVGSAPCATHVHRALQLIANDHTHAEIAADLGMSEKGVERMLGQQP